MNNIFAGDKPVAIGCDHAGFEYKTATVQWLNKQALQVSDFGTYTADSVDYPDFAHPVLWPLKKEKQLLEFYFAAVQMEFALLQINTRAYGPALAGKMMWQSLCVNIMMQILSAYLQGLWHCHWLWK